jgi:SAM-dependent methyltransferase
MTGLTDIRRAAYYRMFGSDALLRRMVGPATSVLDVGCSDGRGSEALSRHSAFGVDIYRPALLEAREQRRRTRVVQADVRRLPYSAHSFDLVVALDVIEHFDKPDALAVLEELERVARRWVVVATPCGYLPQPPTIDEPWQEHRCGFEPSELRERGFTVRGMGGPAALRGPYGSFRLGATGKMASVVTSPVARRRSTWAFALLAVKHVGG